VAPGYEHQCAVASAGLDRLSGSRRLNTSCNRRIGARETALFPSAGLAQSIYATAATLIPPVGNCCFPTWQPGVPIIRTIPTPDSEQPVAPRREPRNPALARQETWWRRAWANRILEFRGEHHVHCLDTEDTRMWIVWSISALIAFCFVLSTVEKPPAALRSTPRRKS